MIKINLFKALNATGGNPDIGSEMMSSESSTSNGVLFFKNIFVMLLGIAALFGYENYNIPNLKEQLGIIQNDINEASTFNNKMEALKKEIQKYEKDLKRLNVQTEFLQKTQSERILSVQLISNLTELVNPEVWLTTLTVRDNNIDLNGEAVSETDINQFNNKLVSSPFLKDVLITSIQQKTNTLIKMPIYTYSIKASFVDGKQLIASAANDEAVQLENKKSEKLQTPKNEGEL